MNSGIFIKRRCYMVFSRQFKGKIMKEMNALCFGFNRSLEMIIPSTPGTKITRLNVVMRLISILSKCVVICFRRGKCWFS